MEQVFDIVVDALNDFMRPTGKLYVPGAEAVIPRLQAYVDTLDGVGVLFLYDTHLEGVYEQSEEAKQFPIHCIKGSDGWQLAIDPSQIVIPMYAMEKGVFDMWQESSLRITPFDDHAADGVEREAFFADLKTRGVTTIRISGVAADYCVKWAIDGLVARGFNVEVLGDLTAGIQRPIEQVVQDDFPVHVVII